SSPPAGSGTLPRPGRRGTFLRDRGPHPWPRPRRAPQEGKVVGTCVASSAGLRADRYGVTVPAGSCAPRFSGRSWPGKPSIIYAPGSRQVKEPSAYLRSSRARPKLLIQKAAGGVPAALRCASSSGRMSQVSACLAHIHLEITEVDFGVAIGIVT